MTELIYPPFVPRLSISDREEGEMLPIVGPEGIVVGRASRTWCHSPARPLHPVVHLHIMNRFGQLYLQRRAAGKLVCPHMWDTSVGGHVGYGESLEEALHREAQEELGLYDFNPVYLKTYVFESELEKELVNVFAIVGNFTLAPNPDEVSEGDYWSFDRIHSSYGHQILTPNFESEFPGIRDKLESLL